MLAHALIVSIIMIDQLPNASLNSWMWFYIGALLGRANYIFLEKGPILISSSKNRRSKRKFRKSVK